MRTIVLLRWIMKQYMKPVEMIAVSDAEGKFTPIKFKFKHLDGHYDVYKIDQVLLQQQEIHAGNKMLFFDCMASMFDKPLRLQLKYEVKTCKWWLYKM